MNVKKEHALHCADLCGMAALSYPIVLNMVRAVISWILELRISGASLANPVGISQGAAIGLNLLAGFLALLVPGVLAVKAAGLTPQEMRWCKPTQKWAKRWLVLFLGMASAANLLGALVSRALGAVPPRTSLPAAGGELLLAFVALCVFPAVGEELFFRGVLQGLLQPMGKTAAVWGTAILFGLLHGSLAGCINAFLCGLVLSGCAQATGSLLPGMALHFVNNLLAFIGAYLTQYSSAQLYQLVLFLLPLAAIGIELLRHPLQIHKTKKANNRLTESKGYKVAVLALAAFCLLRSFELL